MCSFLNLSRILAAATIAMLVGCGVSKAPTTTMSGAAPMQPITQACTTPITGTMQDSLTGKPIAGGSALLETGTPQVVAGILNSVVIFLETTRAVSDADGAFKLCAPGPLSSPAIVVLLALDAAGNEYPPYVAGATDAMGLQSVAMGECFVICDPSTGAMPNLAPTILEGAVTSTPGERAGLVVAQTGIPPLDRSKTT